MVTAVLARSEKGFVDEPWRRFLASIPVARAVVKLGYQTDRARLEPSTSSRCCSTCASRPTRTSRRSLGRIAL